MTPKLRSTAAFAGRSPQRAGQRQRGFTLVELVVALMAGLLVAMAAFLLARNATRVFQYESRIATAQFASVLGMNRLQADLQRVAFMATPNSQIDPLICGDKNTWPDGLKQLAGVMIEDGGSVLRHGADHDLSNLNTLAPDALIIGGAFSTTEQFATRLISDSSAGGKDVFLQVDSGAYTRASAGVADGQYALDEIFAAGRFLRIMDPEGRYEYGVITNYDGTDPDNPYITLAATPDVPTYEGEGTCGLQGMCTGCLVNPVSRVLYDLRTIDPAIYTRYKGMFDVAATHAASSRHKGVAAARRTELVRVELDQNSTEIPDTLEVVAEYAVDLEFGVTIAEPPYTSPSLLRYDLDDPEVYTITKSVANGGNPEIVRSVQLRMSVRGSERDRDVGIGAPQGGGLFRFQLGATAGFVRLRTLTADVALYNQSGVTW